MLALKVGTMFSHGDLTHNVHLQCKGKVVNAISYLSSLWIYKDDDVLLLIV